MAVGHRRHLFHQVPVGVHRVLGEAGLVTAEVVGVEVVGAGDRAGELAPAERAVGHHARRPSSRQVSMIAPSMSRLHSEYSVWRAAIGWMATARRMVSRRASDRPMWPILPAVTSSAIAPTVSSIGTVRVRTVPVVQVHVVHSQPGQRALDRPPHVLGRPSTARRRVTGLVAHDAELGGQDDLARAGPRSPRPRPPRWCAGRRCRRCRAASRRGRGRGWMVAALVAVVAAVGRAEAHATEADGAGGRATAAAARRRPRPNVRRAPRRPPRRVRPWRGRARRPGGVAALGAPARRAGAAAGAVAPATRPR